MRELHEYLTLPWTIERGEYDDDGEYLALTVVELPGFVVAGRTEEEVEQEFWPAFEAFLESYLQDGEEPPLPEGVASRAPEATVRNMAPELRWSPNLKPRFDTTGMGTTSRIHPQALLSV